MQRLSAREVKLGTDVAASEFWEADNKKYNLDFKSENAAEDMKKTGEEMIAYYEDWVNNYPSFHFSLCSSVCCVYPSKSSFLSSSSGGSGAVAALATIDAIRAAILLRKVSV